MDGGGGGEGGDEDATKPYCICRRPSYGEMVACDNECSDEWFHIACVGLRAAPTGKWFCPDCQARIRAAGEARRKSGGGGPVAGGGGAPRPGAIPRR